MHAIEPFFARPAEVECADRLLLLSQHFPPGEAAGARRWEKLAHFAAERGFALDVVTMAPGDLPSRDPSRLETLPAGTRVFGVGAARHPVASAIDTLWSWKNRLRAKPRPGSGGPAAPASASGGTVWVRREEVIARRYTPAVWASTVRALLHQLDEAAWAEAAGTLAARIVDSARHRAIVSCGPPHRVHRAAQRLSHTTGIPFVVDLRDPWSRAERVIESVASPIWYRMAERLEASAFADASLVVMNTPAAAEVMARVYPALAAKILSVTNGFDEDEPIECDFGPAFVIAYAGSIYLDRSPRNLFRATRRVASELHVPKDALKIELMGHYDVAAIRAMAAEEGVEERVVLHPAGSLRDVSKLLARSALLVNLPQDSDLAIPSKIFDYIVRPAWLLALAVPESATGRVLAGTRADVIAPDDVAGIEHVLRERFLAYRAGERPRPIGEDPRLGRAHQARTLFDALARRGIRPMAKPPR